MPIRFLRRCLIGALCLVALPSTAGAQEPASGNHATALIEAMGDFLEDAEQFTFTFASVYTEMSAPATIDATLTRMEDEFDIFVPLGDLVASDAGRRILDGVNEITYLGLDEVDGISCHHVFAQQDDLDFEVWVEDGSVLVPRKLILNFNDEGGPTYTALLSNWDFSPHLPDAVFTQPAPEGARRVDLQGN